MTVLTTSDKNSLQVI